MLLIPQLLFLFLFLISSAASEYQGFKFNGFKSADLTLDGIAKFTPKGLLALTNGTKQQQGHAFFPTPIHFKNTSNGSVFSFSTSFVFSIIPEYPTLGGHGFAFMVAPTPGLPGALPSQYLGLFNYSNNGNSTNHVISVVFDTVQNLDLNDINDNRVGININGLDSKVSMPAGYYSQTNEEFQALRLISGKIMQVWVEYDGLEKELYATIAPINVEKPKPLLSLKVDLSTIFDQTMYAGFSSSTGSFYSSHYILGWSFKVNGVAEKLSLSQLPKLPRIGPRKTSKLLTMGLPLSFFVVITLGVPGVVYHVRRKRKFAEFVEDWELDYRTNRFTYKDLYISTKGFREKELLGTGGFGRVYKGTLPKSKAEIAVKKVSHGSRQGMREFVAEIVTLGRLRHRNLVQLLGYCRRKNELLLVYDYMPNASLDKFLYNQPKSTLTWNQRFKIIKGVASGLLYLHEGWEQIVIHRDVKASNVLLDGEFNPRLGDFGLARLYDHGTDPQTTYVAGTLGYLAPELTRNGIGKAMRSTDVFVFGAFLLEVACGRRPIEPQALPEDQVLVDWVFSFWQRGELLGAFDKNMGSDYIEEEVQVVLKVGLVCSHWEPLARPSMRQVVQYLEGDIPLPDLEYFGISMTRLNFAPIQGFDDFTMSCLSSVQNGFSYSIKESVLSGGDDIRCL